MKSSEYKDKLSEYSAADRVIIQASMNAERLANKKSSAKKAAVKKPVAKKADAPKPTDSRFTGMGAGKPKPSGAGGYTAGSAKNNKSTYTTGSGVRYTSTAKKTVAPVKKKNENPLGGFSMIGRVLGEPFGKNPKKKFTK